MLSMIEHPTEGEQNAIPVTLASSELAVRGNESIRVIEARSNVSNGGIHNRLIINGGWGTDEHTYARLRDGLAKTGRVVSSFGHTRKGNSEVGLDNKHPEAERRKAENLLAVVGASEGRCDVVAHSEGAINTLIAACEDPAKFGNIVLVGPAGLIGEDSLLKLVKRFAQKMQVENRTAGEAREAQQVSSTPIAWDNPSQVKRTLTEASKGSITYVLANVRRAIAEGRAIAEADITDMLLFVRTQNIKIIVMHGVDDKAMPMDKVQGVLGKALSDDSQTGYKKGDNRLIDGFISMDPRLHDDIIHHPDVFVGAISGILNSLEQPPESSNERDARMRNSEPKPRPRRFTRFSGALLERMRRI